VDNSFSLLFEQMVRQPRPEPERYFVLVIKAENLDAGFFAGSTVVGNAVRGPGKRNPAGRLPRHPVDRSHQTFCD
jgi:hypothetical protein